MLCGIHIIEEGISKFTDLGVVHLDAEKELAETKANLLRFMNKYNKDPRRAHPKLTECERASLAHVDPDVNLGEEETSLIEENVPPWTSTSKRNQDPAIRLSFHLD